MDKEMFIDPGEPCASCNVPKAKHNLASGHMICNRYRPAPPSPDEKPEQEIKASMIPKTGVLWACTRGGMCTKSRDIGGQCEVCGNPPAVPRPTADEKPEQEKP